MPRLEDRMRARVSLLARECPSYAARPRVTGPPPPERTVGIVTSGALHRRSEPPFPFGSPQCRELPAWTPAGDIVMSHVSIYFDRTGFQRDLNVVYPIDRLRETVADGRIGAGAVMRFFRDGRHRPRRNAGHRGDDRSPLRAPARRHRPASRSDHLHARRGRAGPYDRAARPPDGGTWFVTSAHGDDQAAARALAALEEAISLRGGSTADQADIDGRSGALVGSPLFKYRLPLCSA